MSELVSDHGMATICGILIDADLWILDPDRREELLSQIKGEIPEDTWAMILSEYRRPPATEGDEGGISDVMIVGLWAELFAEPLSELWLAVMAYHAHYIDGNDFAFGYLTAQLVQRREMEEDFLRGRKSVESGRLGAVMSAKQRRPATDRVLREMRRLVEGGHGPRQAASIAARGGVGTSASANQKLWNRHLKK